MSHPIAGYIGTPYERVEFTHCADDNSHHEQTVTRRALASPWKPPAPPANDSWDLDYLLGY